MRVLSPHGSVQSRHDAPPAHRVSRAVLIPGLLLLLTLTPAAVGSGAADPCGPAIAPVVAGTQDGGGKLDPRARIALARLQSGESVASLLATKASVSPEGELNVFIVGDAKRDELEAAGARIRTEAGGVFTAYVPPAAVAAVSALSGVRRIVGAAPLEHEINLSVPTTAATPQRNPGPGFEGLNGEGVIIGDVDSGISYTHEDFRKPDLTTRILSMWDQTDAIGPHPASYAYGSEWQPADINSGFARERDTDGHGTWVASQLAGDGSQTGPGSAPAFTYVGMAPKADLVIVKTDYYDTSILDGASYIFSRATALGKPAVVNLSLGGHYGPHDGTSPLEAGLSALTGPGRLVCASAGNQRNTPIHAQVFATPAGASANLVVNGSATGRLVAIDGYYESTENMNLTILEPCGCTIGPIPRGSSNAPYPGQFTPSGTIYVENGLAVTATGDYEVYIEINVQSGSQTMNGTWNNKFTSVTLGPANGEVDLWTYFASSGVTANYTTGVDISTELVTEPGNAVEVITAGAWTTRQTWIDCGSHTVSFSGSNAPGNLAPFTSPGPTRDNRQKPDIAAPGTAIAGALTRDVSVSCPAGNSAYLPGLVHVMSAGTSASSAHVSGACALILQALGPVTPAFVKSYLATNATLDGFTGTVWNKDWGYGKLHLGDLTKPTSLVTSPNGPVSWTVGSSQAITWNAQDSYLGVVGVDLKLSRSGPGGPFENIALNTSNTGSYNWVVTGPPTSNAWMQVTARDQAGNTGVDLSDAAFTIAPSGPMPCQYPPAGQDSVWATGHATMSLFDPPRFLDVTLEGPIKTQRSSSFLQSGRLTVNTVVTSMNLAGVSCLGPFSIQLNPPQGSTQGQVSEVAPGTCYPATSFLNAFVNVQIASTVLHNIQPLPINAPVLSLPPYDDIHTGGNVVMLVNSGGTPIGQLESFTFTPQQALDCMACSSQIDLTLNGSPVLPVAMTGPMWMQRDAPLFNTTTGFWETATRLTRLDLSGDFSPLGPIHLNLNPNVATTGQIILPGYGSFPGTGYFDLYFRLSSVLNPDLLMSNQAASHCTGTVTGVPTTGTPYTTGTFTTTVDDKKKTPTGGVPTQEHRPTTTTPGGCRKFPPAPKKYYYCGTCNLMVQLTGQPAVMVSNMNAQWVVNVQEPFVDGDTGLDGVYANSEVLSGSGFSPAFGGTVSFQKSGLGTDIEGRIDQLTSVTEYPAHSYLDERLEVHIPGQPPLKNFQPYRITATVSNIPFSETHTGTDSIPLYDFSGVQRGKIKLLAVSPTLPYDGTCSYAPACGVVQSGVEEGDPNPPPELVLLAPMPNPFSDSVFLRFGLPKRGDVSVGVFDLSGRLIRTLRLAGAPAGPQSVTWDGRDDSGRLMGNGMYLYKVRAAGKTITGRVIRVH